MMNAGPAPWGEVKPAAVAIGGSAGAVGALLEILPRLPPRFAAPVFVVLHVPRDRKSLLAEIFGAACPLRVKEAEDKETITPSVVYVAPPDYHLLVEPNGQLSLSVAEPVQYSRPAIDVLFDSAADAYREKLVGIILTGANADGAAGLAAVARAGGLAIVQDRGSAQASAMPAAALQACPQARELTLPEIAECLCAIGSNL
jgi:two-component system chemotaxis response regulator CheB